MRVVTHLSGFPDMFPLRALTDDSVEELVVDYMRRGGVVTVDFDPSRPVGRIERVIRTEQGVAVEIEMAQPVPFEVAELSPAIIGRNDYSIAGLSWVAGPPLDKPDATD